MWKNAQLTYLQIIIFNTNLKLDSVFPSVFNRLPRKVTILGGI